MGQNWHSKQLPYYLYENKRVSSRLSAPRRGAFPGDEAALPLCAVSQTFIYSIMLVTTPREKGLLIHFTADTVSTQWITLNQALLTSENEARQRALQSIHHISIMVT